jgi:hypothetical protein
VWHSSDGLNWELTAELPLAAAATVAHDGGTTVVGGVDEVIDYGVGRAVLASSADGSTWTMTDPLADPQSGILDIASRDGAFLAVGSEWALGGDEPRSLLQSSPDGSAWTAITSRMFDGLEATAVGSSDELTIVAGTRNGAAKPSILWSQDLETFRKGAFAKKPARDGVRLTGVTIDHETGLAVVVGSNGYRPAIWVSKLK